MSALVMRAANCLIGYHSGIAIGREHTDPSRASWAAEVDLCHMFQITPPRCPIYRPPSATGMLPITRTSTLKGICRPWERGVLGYSIPVSYTHLRAHETDSYLVCRL